MLYTEEEMRSAICSGYLNGWNDGYDNTSRRSVQDGYDLADSYLQELNFRKGEEE